MSLHVMRQQCQAQYEAELLAEQKRRQPKARKRFARLPDDVEQAIYEKIKASELYREVLRLEAEIEREEAYRDVLLNTAAERVVFKPVDCMHRLQVSYSTGWATQGYGACTYAKGSLEPYADRLRRLGFTVHIRETNYQPARGLCGCPHADYELWANCPPWMYDAAKRTLTLGDAIKSMKSRQINPLVYNPFLPDWCRL